MIKYGVADYGLNVWDGGRYDIQLRLEELKNIGFDGTERLECNDAADAMYRAAVYKRLNMDFATCLSSAGIEQSNSFTAALGKEYVWLTPGESLRTNVDMDSFIRRAKRFTQAAKCAGVKAALHNHLGLRIQDQDEIEQFMTEVPDAYLLLDIGHLHGAGGDILTIIEKYISRIAAIHFKDVFIKDASIGLEQWPERLRFCELGAGNCQLPWQQAAQLLKNLGYNRWVFIEHDTHLRNPLLDLKTSLDALKPLFS